VDLDGGASHARNLNTLGRWSRQLSARSAVEVQAYVDRLDRNELSRARSTSDAIDPSAQHTFGLGERNDVIWGLGYRHSRNTLAQTSPLMTVRDPEFALNLFSAFIQDEFQLVPQKLTLTAGVKLERNDFTGLEVQPTVRAVFKPAQHQTLWAAGSRAVRTPDAFSGKEIASVVGGAPFPGPDGNFYLPTIVGNPNVLSEVVHAFELGYRVQPAHFVSADLARVLQRLRPTDEHVDRPSHGARRADRHRGDGDGEHHARRIVGRRGIRNGVTGTRLAIDRELRFSRGSV
jgi:iron complex outermembrane receptor protein